MNAPADGLICVMCSEPATQRCSQCQSQIYCSKQCQKTDWRVHKRLCSSYQQFQTPPHENARRAIVFEQDKPVIKFKWVSIEMRGGDDPDDPDDLPFESPILEEYFGPGERGKIQMYYYNRIRRRKLRGNIDLRLREFLIDGSPPNQAVATVAPFAGGIVWCGPLIALKWEKNPPDPASPAYVHMGMEDLSEVVDYLVTYSRPLR